MHCGSSGRMNNGDFLNSRKNGGAGSGENDFKDNLTKEQLQYIETTFMKLLAEEMENNISNWEEFYDLLNETCTPDMPCSKKYEKSTDVQEDTSCLSGCSGFKINTEATKRQYRSCKSNSKSPFRDLKPENPVEQNSKEHYNHGVNSYERNCQYTNNNSKEQKEALKKSSSHRRDEVKETCDAVPKCAKNSNRRTHKGSKNKTHGKDKVDLRDNHMHMNKHDCNVNDRTTESISAKKIELYIHEYYLKCIVLMNYISSTSKLCWQKSKEIFLLILCMLLLVLIAVWRVFWFLVCFIFKLVLFVVLWVTCNVINCSAAMTTKYDILGKIRSFFSNGSDLLFLLTGINIKSIFGRKKAENVEEQEDDSLAVMPTTPDEAVAHLMKQTEDRPFKALCATRQSTNDEIKANYRKMALLVHPDKCLDTHADEAFKVLDSAFKTLTDPEKRSKLMEEEKRRKEWEEFTKRYSNFEEDFETMFNDLINSISCSKCHGKHKRTLVKDRTFYDARYCGDCNAKHSASDGDIWAENSLFGLNWTCYVCMDGEIYELTEWAECQDLRRTIPVNCHRIVCRLGNQPNRPNGSNRRRSKQNERSETKRAHKKRRQKGRKT